MEKSKWHSESKIIEYINGQLSDLEKNEFEKVMKNDSTLYSDVMDFKIAKQAVLEEGRIELRKKIKTISSNYDKTIIELQNTNITKTRIMKNQSKSRFPLIGLVGFLTLAVGAYLFLNQSSGADPKALFAENYSPKTNITDKYLDKIASSGFATTDSDTSAMITLPNGESIEREEFLKQETIRKESLSSALLLFKKDKYAKARIALHAYTSEYVNNVEDRQLAIFHLAKSMLNIGDYKAAADMYEEFLGGEKIEREIMDVAEFDRAISWLQLNEKEAKRYFKDISLDQSHTYQSTAKSMHDTLL